MAIFEVTANSDLTEGKGVQVTKLYTEDLDRAVEEAKKWGVMRVGTGDINILLPDTDEQKVRIWGYRQVEGQWDYGWTAEAYERELVEEKIAVSLFTGDGKFSHQEFWAKPKGAREPADMVNSRDFGIPDRGSAFIHPSEAWTEPYLMKSLWH